MISNITSVRRTGIKTKTETLPEGISDDVYNAVQLTELIVRAGLNRDLDALMSAVEQDPVINDKELGKQALLESLKTHGLYVNWV